MSDFHHAALDSPVSDQSHAHPTDRPARQPLLPHTTDDGSPAVVRPYAMVGGRTRPRYQLAIEALVATTAEPEQLRGLLPEHQRICLLCQEVKSVAEISALLTIPLGVARILVADLAEAGLVAIHQPGAVETGAGRPDTDLMERVLSGLRDLADPAPQTTQARPQRRRVSPEQWLANSHSALIDGLSHVLDVEAGLREALLAPRHGDTIDQLGQVLDVEAGLREALGEHRSDEPE